ncbi:MAG: hypothetical protein RIR11_4440 [Bacteroidota bacterium]|jgi:hypothetical protein
MKYYLFLIIILSASCGDNNVPLDADARRTVDSLASAEIGVERRTIDSLCKEQHTHVLPLLIDSIKKVRLEQIQKQLNSIPK